MMVFGHGLDLGHALLLQNLQRIKSRKLQQPGSICIQHDQSAVVCLAVDLCRILQQCQYLRLA